MVGIIYSPNGTNVYGSRGGAFEEIGSM